MGRIGYKKLIESKYGEFKESEKYKRYQFISLDNKGRDLGESEYTGNNQLGLITYVESSTSKYIIQVLRFGGGKDNFTVFKGKGYKDLNQTLDDLKERNLN